MLALHILLNQWLNQLFGPAISAILLKLGIHIAHPDRPINGVLTLELVVTALLLLFFVIVRLTLSVERPGPVQQFAEMIYEFADNQGQAIVGHGYEPHLPFVTTILMFLLICNCFGLLPGIETPTADPRVPLGVAILTFCYYNYFGFRAHGIWGYIKEFMGPVWWIAPLLFPIEIISHLARMMSLTVRLYANMFASDLLTLVFFSLIPIGVPIVFLALHLGVALIQSYVFMLLALIYLAGAIAHEEDAAH